ncbi:hypothetical protein [Xenorhabdus bovienii]|uniref:Uncharacterized protein n=1 Tax=Xenorhabdus bovienii str. feltiae Moldova TaxID=1398200 RepID=A0A077NVD0_XENBV|nr:hypothetical protein [Xenorhabdus bovienii]CDH02860.1 hypothetical protein XBFM1_480040 [Xenorhabdus bovienii str. feltiae Moldova]
MNIKVTRIFVNGEHDEVYVNNIHEPIEFTDRSVVPKDEASRPIETFTHKEKKYLYSRQVGAEVISDDKVACILLGIK